MIEFCHECREMGFPRKQLQAIAASVYKAEGIPRARRTVVILCDNRRIRALNRHYRHLDRATDVLSFEFNDPDLLGEIYISLQRCKAQHPRSGLSYDDEVKRVFIHGLVHLLGFDHQSTVQRARMQAREMMYCRGFPVD